MASAYNIYGLWVILSTGTHQNKPSIVDVMLIFSGFIYSTKKKEEEEEIESNIGNACVCIT